MPQSSTHTQPTAAPRTRPSTGLGERVRQQRIARGLTQTDLAGGKFSKEYISQVELGKTMPTRETLEYLAAKLQIDPGYLSQGVSSEDQARIEGMLARAEALTYDQRYDEAVEAFLDATTSVAASGSLEFVVRRSAGEAWARMERGEVREGLAALIAVKDAAGHESVGSRYLAEVLWKIGVARLKLGSTHVALGLINESLALMESSGLSIDGQRVEVLRWRCATYQRLKDVESARADAELALELAEQLDDPRAIANVHFQASLVAEREGRFGVARLHAERARAKYEEIADQSRLGTVLNNLALVQFQLGDKDTALSNLKRSYGILLEAGDEARCGMAVSTIASIHLATGDAALAEEQARLALTLYQAAGKDEFAEDIAETELVLAGALMEEDRLDEAEAILKGAEKVFEQLRSISDLARTFVALGDVAVRREHHEEAARLYRRSASLLQDVRI